MEKAETESRYSTPSALPSILWVTPKWPFPVNDGARQATVQLLSEVCRAGAAVELCALVQPGEEVEATRAIRELGVRSVVIEQRESASPLARVRQAVLRPRTPLTVSPYACAAIRQRLKALLDQDDDRVIVFDGVHGAAGWLPLSGRYKRARVVYRAHNVEKDLWVRGAAEARSPVMKGVLSAQAFLMSRFEGQVVNRSDAIFPVSEVDASIFRRLAPTKKIVSLPIGIPRGKYVFPGPEQRAAFSNLLFVGRLDWPPNRDGLKWLLDEVWPSVNRQVPYLTLTVVGSGDGSWLESYRRMPGVKVLGKVQDLAPYYESCVATVVPVFFGSGTRVKAIESAMNARACISTRLGVEGVGLDPASTYFNAESVSEWVETLISFGREEQVREAWRCGKAAYDYASEIFDPPRIARRFLEALPR